MKISDLKKVVAMSGVQQVLASAVDGSPILGEVSAPSHPLTAGSYNEYITDDGVELTFIQSVSIDSNPKPSFTKYPGAPWVVLDGPQ